MWDYINQEENERWNIQDEPSADMVLKEVNGYTWADKKLVKGFADLKDDGSTACGCWIYSGVYAGGDCTRAKGSASTVMAVQDGKLAAEAIHAQLEEKSNG